MMHLTIFDTKSLTSRKKEREKKKKERKQKICFF